MKLKMLNKTSKKVLAAGVMALALISVTVPTYGNSEVYAKSTSESKILNTSVKVSTKATYKDKEGNYEAIIKTPKAVGKAKGLDELNKKIEAYTKKIQQDYVKDKKSAPEGRQSVVTNYKTLTNTKEILAIQINTTVAMGGSNSYSKYFTLNKGTGKMVALKDLFEKNADYVTVISENLIAQMNEIMDKDDSKSYFIQRGTEDESIGEDFYFSKIKKDQSFYIDKKGNLVITFNKYEAAPGYMGEVKFEIPNKVIADILK